MTAHTLRTLNLSAGTPVVLPGRRLGRIVKPSRLGNAHGYDVLTGREDGTEGYAPHFIEAHAVEAAQVGVNICRYPRGTHWCGLLHVHAVDLDALESPMPHPHGGTR